MTSFQFQICEDFNLEIHKFLKKEKGSYLKPTNSIYGRGTISIFLYDFKLKMKSKCVIMF